MMKTTGFNVPPAMQNWDIWRWKSKIFFFVKNEGTVFYLLGHLKVFFLQNHDTRICTQVKKKMSSSSQSFSPKSSLWFELRIHMQIFDPSWLKLSEIVIHSGQKKFFKWNLILTFKNVNNWWRHNYGTFQVDFPIFCQSPILQFFCSLCNTGGEKVLMFDLRY